MTDSAIALGIFGSDKAVLATDATAGVHTLKVTTNAASDGIVVEGFAAAKYVIGTAKAGGVHTLCATTGAANAAIALQGAAGEKIVLGTVLSGGVHAIAVTTGAANSSVTIAGFGSGLVRLATVLAGGVHILAVTAAPDNGFAIASFAAGESVIAAAKSGNVYSLALSGLMDPEAAAYFAAAGITNAAAKGLINDFVVGLKADLAISTLGSVFDRLWITANTDIGATVVDLCGNAPATIVNSFSFTPWRGLTANNSAYFRSNFNEASSGVNYQNGSHAYFVYLRSGSNMGMGSAASMGVWRNTAPFGVRGHVVLNNSNVGVFYEYDSQLSYNFDGVYRGLWLISRTGASAVQCFRDAGVLASGSSTPTTAINANYPFLGINVDGSTTAATNPYCMGLCGFARGLTGAEAALFQARVNGLMDGLFVL